MILTIIYTFFTFIRLAKISDGCCDSLESFFILLSLGVVKFGTRLVRIYPNLISDTRPCWDWLKCIVVSSLK